MNRTDRAKVTLESYVKSVAAFIEERGLSDVVLAGHSLGGLTIPGVAARIPSRIKRVVWVTALVALDGQPIIDPSTSPLAAAADSQPERSLTMDLMGKEFLDGHLQRRTTAAQGLRNVGAVPAASSAAVYAGRDGALLRYRNPEQLYRLRERSRAGPRRAQLASPLLEPAQELDAQVH